MIIALGHERAGYYTNDKHLSKALRKAGNHVNELVWELPVTEYHKKLMTTKYCDLTNHPGIPEAGAAQAAAFLQCFVEEGVHWAHIDVAGTTMVANAATGYGARLLIEYVHEVASPILPHWSVSSTCIKYKSFDSTAKFAYIIIIFFFINPWQLWKFKFR